MKILAIDPGNEQSGYVVWDGCKILEMGKIDNKSMFIKILDLSLEENIHLSIEKVASYGMAVGATIFETCFWIGRFETAFTVDFEKIKPIYRQDIKLHFCHSNKANDSNIRQALIDRFESNLKSKKRPIGVLKGVSKDIWSALALAVYYQDKFLSE